MWRQRARGCAEGEARRRGQLCWALLPPRAAEARPPTASRAARREVRRAGPHAAPRRSPRALELTAPPPAHPRAAASIPHPARSYAHLAAGLAVGLSNLASGLSIGMCADIGVRDSSRQPKLYIGMVLIWSFASALGLYGLIVGLIIAVKNDNLICETGSV